MSGQTGLKDGTWDSARCLLFRWGALKVGITKATPPKLSVKTDAVRRATEMVALSRTPGVGEVSNANIELLTSDFISKIWPKMPKHGGTLETFTITETVTHPSIRGSYGEIWDTCRIVGLEGPDLDISEKSLITKLEINVVNRWLRGDDGVWKSLFELDLPMSQSAKQFAF